MTDTVVNKVVIVGGGTAGWLTALHVKSALCQKAEVTLIESPDVPTIGVGEGTQPTLRAHFRALNIDENECVRETGASFKNGIRFVGWGGGRTPDEYLHPFFSGPAAERGSPMSRIHLWHALALQSRMADVSLADLFPESILIRQRKAPIGLRDGKPMESPVVNYAFHIDAAQLGLYLRKHAAARGTKHISDQVEGVTRNDDGGIAKVHTRNHGDFEGEFFIDCTGFHRLLIGELSDDFCDFGQWLLNDRAVTTRLANDEQTPIDSCTTSTAMRYGWTWQVPLLERRGIGYVYSSRFVSDDDAEKELRAFLEGCAGDTGLVRFRTGYYRQQWIKNCVCIGLSGGFIEPLEATGIALVSYSLFRLLELWPSTSFPTQLSTRFNELMGRSFEWVRDFIVMHYCLSQREDTDYWKAVRRDEAIPDSARASLETLGRSWPFGEGGVGKECYRLPDASLACVLAGLNHLPRLTNPFLAGIDSGQIDKMLDPIVRGVQGIPRICPDHREYLQWLNKN